MPLFNVQIEGTIVILADSEMNAVAKAQAILYSGAARIGEDLSAIDADEINTREDLLDQWTDDALPYGAEDNKPISDYLDQ